MYKWIEHRTRKAFSKPSTFNKHCSNNPITVRTQTMSKFNKLPSQEYLKECFEYTNGNFIWKERPAHHFTSIIAFNTFKAQYVGKVVKANNDTAGYAQIRINKKAFSYHRLVWKYHTGLEPLGQIDHINRDKFDNRIENLRDVSISENNHNKINPSDNNSGYKGVCFKKNKGKWESTFTIRGNTLFLGIFTDKEDAIKARLEAELKDWSHLEDKVKERVRKEITLDYLKECFYYNDGVLYWKERPLHHFKNDGICRMWNNKFSNSKAGSSKLGYLYISLGYKEISAHRTIYQICNNLDKLQDDLVVDHIDGDNLNNHIENLRLITKSQNMMNRSKNKNSMYKGVYFNKNKNKWSAKIQCDSEVTCLGTFDTPELAHAAYCKAATELHKEYANFGN